MCSLLRRLRTVIVANLKRLMKKGTRLFIGGEEVDLSVNPGIKYNYVVDELLSPATVRNTFSKTVTLPSTPRNHRVFGHIFEADQVNGDFDPSKKVEFVLYSGSEVYEMGYAKLDAVKRTYKDTTYDVSLYGGLGSLFWNLSYMPDDETGDGRKKTLADLDFGGGDDELDFDINIDTVSQAWAEINSPGSKFNVINFAPSCYNGLPSDYDADKVLVYTGYQSGAATRGNRNSLQVTHTESGVTYEPYNGYILAELNREFTGDEMREWRSYLTRPVANVRRILEAMTSPAVNGGYQVVLDQSFFNDNNPYWSQAWVTLPLLTSLEYTGKQEHTELEISLGTAVSGMTQTGSPGYYEDRGVIISGDTSENRGGMRMKLDVSIDALVSSGPADTLYPSAYSPSYGSDYKCSIFLQIVAYDAFGRAVAGSDLYNLTSAWGTRRVSEGSGRSSRYQIYPYFPTPNDYDFSFYGDGYVQCGGGFAYENGNYRWIQDGGDGHIVMTIDQVPAGATLKLLATKVYISPTSYSTSRWDTLWQRQYNSVDGHPYYIPYYMTGFRVTLNSADIWFDTDEAIRSGAHFTKKTLLATSYTPAEFLLSYAKLFGLYFVKDPYERKVTIMPRSEFFKRNDLTDIQDQIDRSDNAKMTPLSFDNKWYLWKLDTEGEYAEQFADTYGHTYGAMRFNTKYGFNNATNEVLSGNIFKNALQVTERSPYFCIANQNPGVLPWRFGGFTYNLYEDWDNTYEVEYKPLSTVDLFTRLSDTIYYDVWDKVQLHGTDNDPIDGSGVLLFYNGMKSLLTPDGRDAGFMLSDDNSTMKLLNDSTPCWLSSQVDYDGNGIHICTHITEAPHFSRYIRNANGNILLSWDFAIPDIFYIPGTYQTEGTDIYSLFWKDYINELYDPNTRIVERRVRIKGKPTVEWLRRFYWFDNAIWRMSEISDWDPDEEGLTSVTFVRVNDVSKYTNGEPTVGQVITLTPSKSPIASTGETITIAVSINDGGSWTLRSYDSNVILSAESGTGDATVTATFPGNPYPAMIKEWGLVATGDQGATTELYVSQEIAGFEFYRQGSGDIDKDGGQVLMTVSSVTDWTVSSQRGTCSPASGTPTSGTVITLTVPANDSNYVQEFRVTAVNANGAQIPVTLHQNAQYWASLYPYTQTVGSSGGTVTFDLSTNVSDVSSFRLYYDNNWGEAHIENGNQLVVTGYANPASYGYQRNMWVDIYLQDEHGQVVSSKLASCCLYILKPE